MLAPPNEILKVQPNAGTYAVVSLLVFGVGFCDLNAIVHVPFTQRVTYYGPLTLNLAERGRPFRTRTGDVTQSFTYKTTAGGGEEIETRDWSRGSVTRTLLDAHGRTTSATVLSSSGETLSDERFGYDASGRLAYHSRTQHPHGLVETRIRYDAVGRELERSTTKANVNGSPVTLVAKSSFDLTARSVTTFDPVVDGAPPAAREETTVDGLGRPIRVARLSATNTERVERVIGYDIHGQRSYESDTVRTAMIRRHDAFGRETFAISSDGTRLTTSWSAWNEPIGTVAADAEGNPIARTKHLFTNKGRLRAINEELHVDGAARQTRFAWKGARITNSRVGAIDSVDDLVLPAGAYRTEQIERDLAGRVHVRKIAEANGIADPVADPLKIWAQTTTSYVGTIPNTIVTTEPRYGAAYTTSIATDALGRTTQVSEAGGAYQTRARYDEAGNAIEIQRPGMNPERAAFDARGLPLTNTLADGKQLHYLYDALGNVRQRTDEAGESTFYDTDELGRVVKVRYPDGSFEQTAYEDGTGQVEATRDRGGQWLSYTYDAGGRVTTVRNGRDPATAPVLVQYLYDAAARLALVKNKDAGVAFDHYDALGRPGTTRTYRYTGATGLSATPTIHDVHSQKHVWSIHDAERASWRMPAAGAEPAAADDPNSKWLQTIVETRDAGANLISQKTATGTSLLEAHGRSAGRLGLRKRITPSGQPLTTDYGFADGSELPPTVDLPPSSVSSLAIPTSGLPLWSRTSLGTFTLAGTANRRDDAKRLSSQRDLAGSRLSMWSYDDRGRVASSLLLQPSLDVSPITDTLIDADFRAARTAPPALTAAQHALLGPEAAELERLNWTATKSTTLHQLQSRTLLLSGAEQSRRTYAFDASGRRTTDGEWTSTWDELGRLTSITSDAASRRIEYLWDPNNRVIARIAKMPNAAGAWELETRTTILARDGLPADATFVWDPTTDRLVAIYTAGASTAPGATAEAGLLRQYLHGDRAYDDPTRIVTAAGTYFPILDEPGTGSPIAIAGADGNLVERILYADPYGDAPRYLHGPLVDDISIEITKTVAGAVAEARIRVHLTDPIAPATLPPSLRLAATRADHTPAYVSPRTPTLSDPQTAVWTLSAADWTTLTTTPTAQSLEIAISTTLRAEGWGDTPVTPLPPWTQKLHPNTATTPAHPILVRTPLADVLTWAAGVEGRGGRGLYELRDAYLAASAESKTKLVVGFKAAPFVEPGTGLVYLRERWLDTSIGMFLTPDPVGYRDSSNLYAFCANDPVNCSDPLGLARRTASGGINYLGDISNEFLGDTWWSRGLGVAADTVGNTVSDLLSLDAWADANVVAWDSSRSAGERAWSGAKGLGIAALDVFGGQIAGTLGKAGLRIPGVRTVIGRIGESAVGRVLTAEDNPLRCFDDIGEAAARGFSEGSAEAYAQLAPQITRQQQIVMRNVAASQVARRASRFSVHSDRTASVVTPYEVALQDLSSEALALREAVKRGAPLFRQGHFGVQETAGAQFWALENPLTAANYAQRYGTAGTNAVDWVMRGRLTRNGRFVVRRAPAYGANRGGELEVVTKRGSVIFDWAHFLGGL